jgi:dipeptidyl aminopeptidase/acylaminoacyl peptidase
MRTFDRAKWSSSPRRPWWVLAVWAALTLGLLAPAAPARAEVIDYDPQTQDVPTVVDPAELTLLAKLQGAPVTYLLADPSPDGRWAYGYMGQGVGFLNMTTGEFVAPQADMGQALGNMWWQDNGTMRYVIGEVAVDDQGNPVEWRLSRVTAVAATGAVDRTALGALPLTVSPIAASPDGSWLLATEVPTGTVAAKLVTLRPRYDLPSPIPAGAPGVLGELAPRQIELQQATFKLVLKPLGAGTTKVLAELPADTGLQSSNWSPDGQHVTVTTSTMPGWDGDRQRDNDPPPVGLPNLGSINVQEALGLVKPADNPLVTGTRMYVFDAGTGRTVKTLENKDYPAGVLNSLGWSPSGQHAVLVMTARSDLEGRPNPIYSHASGVHFWLLDANYVPVKEITGPNLGSLSTQLGWLNDSTLFFAVPAELDTRVDTYDLATAQLKTIWSRPGSSWQMVGAAGQLIFPHSAVDEPMELWTADAANVAGTARAVTTDGAAVAEASRLKSATVTWTTSDGKTLTGLYVYREDMPYPPAKPGPVVVWQQGGPGGQIVDDFGTHVEAPYSLLPQFGIPVFLANAAGRTVQNEQFYSDMAAGRNFGQLDIQQIKEGVDALVARKLVDPKKVGITGCSYGGYFTLQSIRTYPGVYAAANAQCSLSDLFEEFTFGYTPFVAYLMGRAPMADPAEYLKDAPFYGSKDVTTPTLLFHGKQDFLPVSLIQQYHDELDARHVPVTFLRVNNEQHGFSNAKSQLYAAQLQLNFFRDRLGVADTSPPAKIKPVYLPIAHRGQG